MLAGFETASAGRILLDGRDIAAVPPHQRPVNMMFQNYALFPHLTVASNIAFGLKRAGAAERRDRRARRGNGGAGQARGFEKRKPDQLSGGQRQRVALARALARRPKLILLDEPLAALDAGMRRQMQFFLMALQRRLGMTFLFVTHDQEEAMTMADRIGIMDKGRVMQVATPAELYEAPNSRWVAEFVGDINLFEGGMPRAQAIGGVIVATAGCGRSSWPSAPAGDQAMRDGRVAIRPEKIKAIARGQPAGGRRRSTCCTASSPTSPISAT